ncbi:MAG TPA: 2-iminoacetate synthase ThiH [Candidatus Scatomonas pullistercoris]|uniref:2-iminoacetate synthase ThiH n=1 Tax=Candidatus Scatomonas pullistercoris TaxID=2840920 RepID=A0A9D1T9M1_9FIRM|nr:2-iminoacetate synthase ThiH [Candidatus Scatomonas pullistercoris]
MSDTFVNESILNDEVREHLKENRTDHMKYLPDMEVLESDVMDQVISMMQAYDYEKYTERDVRRALDKENRGPEEFAALLSPAAMPFLEEMAQKAREETRRHFGNSVYLFTPLYIANYCENYCIYCGFNCHNKIRRAQLNEEEIEKEMQAIAGTGLQEILILTGESRKKSTVEYIGKACRIARKYFKVIGLEVYPMNSDEYRYLHECGADYVTVFQETYDSDKYETLHLAGHKRVFPYRLNAQERALLGGMRGVGFGALLGLSDFRKDAFATGIHAWLLQRKYPHAEIAFSCPRLRPIINNDKINPMDVHEAQLLQVVTAYRLLMPFAGITVSTRECARVRDNLACIAATKISAGVSTGVGSHVEEMEDQGDEQFEISDSRSVDQVYRDLEKLGQQPVMNDYVYV